MTTDATEHLIHESAPTDDHDNEDPENQDRAKQQESRARTGRKSTAGSPEPESDPLFGTGLAFSQGWAAHESAVTVSFATAARALPRLVKLALSWCWNADRTAVLLIAGSELWTGAASAFGLLATNRVLTRVLADPSPAHLRGAAGGILLVAALAAAGALAGTLARTTTNRLKPKAERAAYTALLTRTVRVEMLVFQGSDFKSALESGQYGAAWIGPQLSQILAIASGLMSIAAAAGVLAILNPLLMLLLPVIVLPQAAASARAARRRNVSRLRWLGRMRQQMHLTRLLIDQGPAEEVRMHDAGTFLLKHYQRLAKANESEQSRLARIDARESLAASSAAGLASAATYLLLAVMLSTGRVPIAEAATAFMALRMGTGQISTLLYAVTECYEYGLYTADLDDAIRMADAAAIPPSGRPQPGPPELIEARGVGFSYPGADRPALAGVDAQVRRGEVVALVGANGSGKTTLARLLAGLYLPDAGEVAWDGVSTADLDRAELFDQVAVLSQHFEHWPFTAAANLTVGRHAGPSGPADLDAAAAKAGADQLIGQLPRRWETLLAPEHAGGMDLSGGQWQLVGLARAFHRDAAVLVLDEPTAALDPMIESSTFERVRRLAGGRTVLMITHRLYSAIHADRILVLDQGRIIESGTHAELIRARGSYQAMFDLQARAYDAEPQPEA
ncbi:MAG TPA: ABC transporter ATP-binding protein [Actinocrinis sp.]|nr:ABC transporter ATP-binding protein [Actinocrinis sp.]